MHNAHTITICLFVHCTHFHIIIVMKTAYASTQVHNTKKDNQEVNHNQQSHAKRYIKGSQGSAFYLVYNAQTNCAFAHTHCTQFVY